MKKFNNKHNILSHQHYNNKHQIKVKNNKQ